MYDCFTVSHMREERNIESTFRGKYHISFNVKQDNGKGERMSLPLFLHRHDVQVPATRQMISPSWLIPSKMLLKAFALKVPLFFIKFACWSSSMTLYDVLFFRPIADPLVPTL